MSVRTTTLDNGMTVITDDMPHLESASLGIWVKAGSRSETALTPTAAGCATPHRHTPTSCASAHTNSRA